MTTLLDQAISRTKTLPPDRQDEVGSMLLALVEQEHSDLRLSAIQQNEVRRRLAEEGDIVPPPEMDAFFSKLT